MNKTKTFKIGESCVGGIIQIKVSEGTYFPQGTTIKVLVKKWKSGDLIKDGWIIFMLMRLRKLLAQ